MWKIKTVKISCGKPFQLMKNVYIEMYIDSFPNLYNVPIYSMQALGNRVRKAGRSGMGIVLLHVPGYKKVLSTPVLDTHMYHNSHMMYCTVRTYLKVLSRGECLKEYQRK